jgi:hypothetical protein
MKKLFTLLLCGLSFLANAQNNLPTKNGDNFVSPGTWTIAPKFGLTQFYGELNTQKMSGVFGLGLEKRLTPVLSLALEIEGGNIQGSKTEYYNSKFRADYGQASLLGKVNLTQMFGSRRRERIRLNNINRATTATNDDTKYEQMFTTDSIAYVKSNLGKKYTGGPLFNRLNISAYAGFGAMRYNSFAYDLTSGALIRYTSIPGVNGAHTPIGSKYGKATSNQGIYYTKERTVHVGIQATYALNNNVDLGLDWRISRVGNDKVDATSGESKATPYGAGSYSGTANDHFGFVAIRLGFHFGEGRSKKERKAYELLQEKLKSGKKATDF